MVSSPDPLIRAEYRPWVVLIAALLLHVVSVCTLGLKWKSGNDFYSYYVSARAPLAGYHPYNDGYFDVDHPVFHAAALAHSKAWGNEVPAWLKDKDGIPNWIRKIGGVPYPPQTYLVFVPFTRTSQWHLALWSWMAFLTVIALFCGYTLSWSFDPEARRSAMTNAWVTTAILLNPVTGSAIANGQAALIICGAVALGELAIRRGYYLLGVIAWSFCVAKPNLGLPFLFLAYAIGGWRQFRDVCLAGLVINVLSGLILVGDPLMAVDFFRSILKNTAVYMADPANSADNPHIIGWNHLYWLLGGPVVNLTASKALASYGVWGVLLWACVGPRKGRRLSPTFWLAAAVAGSLLCSQAHNYDFILACLVTPYIFWLWDHHHRTDAFFLGSLIIACSPPLPIIQYLGKILALNPHGIDWLLSYRALGAAILALYLLISGRLSAAPSDPVLGRPEDVPSRADAGGTPAAN
jgi:hypothetical protein